MVVKELFAVLGLEVEEQAFEKAEAVIHGLKSGLFAVVGGAVAAGLGLLELGRETANASLDAYKLSLRLGVTTDAAQELAYAANASGSSVESLTTAMFRMNRTIASAKGGSKEAQKALSGLGIPLKELYEMSPDEQFEKLAGGLHDIQDASKKASKEQGIFGRGVIDLIPLIEKGAEGIAHFREEAHEMGLILSQETIAESREWKKEIRIAGEQVEALKFRIGALVVHGVVKLIKAWSAFKNAHVEQALTAVKVAMWGVVAATVMWLSTTYLGVANVARLLLYATGQAIAFGWANVGAAAKSALAWGLLALKFALVLDAVADVKFAVKDLVAFFNGKGSLTGDIFKIWKDDIHSVKDAVDSILGTLLEIVNLGDWQGKMEKDINATRVAFINEATNRRRRERGMLDANGNPALMSSESPQLAPFANPLSAFSPTAAGPQVGTGGAPILNVTNNITQQPGQDAKELAGHVANQTGEQLKSVMRRTKPVVQ